MTASRAKIPSHRGRFLRGLDGFVLGAGTSGFTGSVICVSRSLSSSAPDVSGTSSPTASSLVPGPGCNIGARQLGRKKKRAATADGFSVCTAGPRQRRRKSRPARGVSRILHSGKDILICVFRSHVLKDLTGTNLRGKYSVCVGINSQMLTNHKPCLSQ